MIEYSVHPDINNIEILYKIEDGEAFFWLNDEYKWVSTGLVYVHSVVQKEQILHHPAFAKEMFYRDILNDT